MVNILFTSKTIPLFLLGIKSVILMMIATPSIYHCYKNKSIPQIFQGTIQQYLKMMLLTSLCGLILLSTNNFSVIGYIFGCLTAFSSIITLIFVTFDYITNIKKINYNNQNVVKNETVSLISEASTLIGAFYLSLLSLGIVVVKYKNVINTIAFILIGVKIIGHLYTKLGDIISDYEQKIVNKDQEDVTDDEFSIIDNIGDLFGDAFGTIIEYLIFGIIIFKLLIINLSHASSIFYVSLEQGYVLLLIIYLISKIKNNLSICNILTICSALFFACLEPAIKFIIYYKYSCYSVLVYMLQALKLKLFILIPIIIILLTLEKIINRVAKILYSRVCVLPLLGIINNIIASAIITYMLTLFSLLCVVIADKHNIISHTSVFDLFIMISVMAIYKTYFGAFTDSACGIIKKQELPAISTQSNDNCQQNNDTFITDYLEELDCKGNIYKLEAKILLNFISQIVLILYTGYRNKFIHVLDAVIITAMITIIYNFSFILYNSISNREAKTYTYQIPMSAFYIIILAHSASTIIFKVNKYYTSNIMFCIVMISMFANISGSLFDCVKKIAEQQGHKKHPYYHDVIQQDMLGDVLKDVVGPIAYSVFLIYAINL